MEKSCGCFIKNILKTGSEEQSCSVKIPFLKLFFGSFNLLLDNFRSFALLSVLYSVLFSALALFIGYSFVCAYPQVMSSDFLCSQSWFSYGIYTILKLFIVSIFAVKWYDFVVKKQSFSFSSTYSIGKKELNSFWFFIVFMLLSLIPVLSLYLLYVRVPNPDWRIEIGYFAVVSIGFLVPFILMRLYSFTAFVLSGEKAPKLCTIWSVNSGNLLKIMLSIFLIFIFMAFVMLSYFNNFRGVDIQSLWWQSVIIEFFYNILFLMSLALFINHCILQKDFLFGRNENEQQQ